MPLRPVIRHHTTTPVNTPNRGSPVERGFDAPLGAEQLSGALAAAAASSSTIRRVGGGFATTSLAASMDAERLAMKRQMRAMDDQSFNGTLVAHLEREHRSDRASADATALMDPSSRSSHFVKVYEETFRQHEARAITSPPRLNDHADARAISQSRLLDRPQSAAALSSRSLQGSRQHSLHSRTRRAASSNSSARSASASYRTTAPSNVKGLFVAFADSAVEEKILNLTREVDSLQMEQEHEHQRHRSELARLLRENAQLQEEAKAAKSIVTELSAAHEQESKDLRVLKEEYETRYRQQLAANEEMQRKTAAAEQEAQRLRDGDGARVFQIDSLQYQVQELQKALRRAEAETAENARRASQHFNEKEVMRRSLEDFERERAQLRATIEVKEKVIVGLEKELGTANDKLSSIAFFKESYGGRRAGAGSSAGGGGSSKLYQKYFGRMPSKREQGPACGTAGVAAPS